ncbi:MAG TPA: hypothetical protein VFW04_01180 [Gemmatimonadaceae bacterium]|nr:hypothetical protein [Gemmatimonadaceae bacterium]
MYDDHGQPGGSDVLLEREIPINGDECCEAAFAHQTQEITVAPARPSFAHYVRDIESVEIPLEPSGHALVEENAAWR